MKFIETNMQDIQTKIRKACIRGERLVRKAEDVRLIAVSKNQPEESIKALLEEGHRIFGENRVQEAYDHWHDLKKDYLDIQLHLIGPLQTNKVKEAVALFDVIHTIDREKLAVELSKEMKKQGRNLPCFIQVNTGAEEQKAGVAVEDLPALLTFCQKQELNIIGLMCIPPVEESPAPHFALLKKLGDEAGLHELSMGMSGDFEKAIPLGATYIRLGTAIFGERVSQDKG